MPLSIKRLETLRSISRFIKTCNYLKTLDYLCSEVPDDPCHSRVCSFLSSQTVFTWQHVRNERLVGCACSWGTGEVTFLATRAAIQRRNPCTGENLLSKSTSEWAAMQLEWNSWLCALQWEHPWQAERPIRFYSFGQHHQGSFSFWLLSTRTLPTPKHKGTLVL